MERIIETYGIAPEDVNIDDIGIGRGVTDRLKEKSLHVNGVSVGERSSQPDRFSNLKAELYWEARMKAISPGFIFEPHKDWQQLTWIKYKVNSDKQIKIEDKQTLKKRTGRSPDVAESYMLTFYEPPFLGFA